MQGFIPIRNLAILILLPWPFYNDTRFIPIKNLAILILTSYYDKVVAGFIPIKNLAILIPQNFLQPYHNQLKVFLIWIHLPKMADWTINHPG